MQMNKVNRRLIWSLERPDNWWMNFEIVFPSYSRITFCDNDKVYTNI